MTNNDLPLTENIENPVNLILLKNLTGKGFDSYVH